MKIHELCSNRRIRKKVKGMNGGLAKVVEEYCMEGLIGKEKLLRNL